MLRLSRGGPQCLSLLARAAVVRRHSLPAPRYASASAFTPTSTPNDPTHATSLALLEKGTQALEDGDLKTAKSLYAQSVSLKRDASSLFNLGVTCYHLKEYDEAITLWEEAIQIQPDNADAHTNLASAYVVSAVPRPDRALEHLYTAASILPEDPEIAFNLAAVLEACGKLEEALEYYKRARKFGVEKADMHIRNVCPILRSIDRES